MRLPTLLQPVVAAIGLTLPLHALAQSDGNPPTDPGGEAVLDGVVFLPERGVLYVTVPDLQRTFDAVAVPGPDGREGETPSTAAVRRLPDGRQVVRLRDLTAQEFQVGWEPKRNSAWIEREGTRVWVRKDRHTVMDGVTFAEASGNLVAPLRELVRSLGTNVRWDAGSKRAVLLGWEIPQDALKSTPGGSQMVDVSELNGWGAVIRWHEEADAAKVTREDHHVWVRRSDKRVAVNLSKQRLRAWQGQTLVLDTRISSGRDGMETPTGQFEAGPLKRRMLISRQYDDAEMPWSVQVRGDIVIHGFPTVPPRAASHGCIRVPLTGANPAKFLYEWIDVGTPIHIADAWPSVEAEVNDPLGT